MLKMQMASAEREANMNNVIVASLFVDNNNED